jgi:hypothetical protein
MDSSALDFSVIVPLVDGRGEELDCLRSWTHDQTYPRDRFQVVLVSAGADAEFDRQAATLLQSQDVLTIGSGSMHDLYEEGGRVGRGATLFFTELHCKGDPHCLSGLREWFDAHSHAVGACARSRHHNTNYLGLCEEAVFDAHVAEVAQNAHWRCVLPRGFAIRRSIYEELGGYEGNLGVFADLMLSARLHRQGYEVGLADNAWVTHRNTDSWKELGKSIQGFAAGQFRFNQRPDACRWQQYLELPEVCRQVLSDERGQAWRELGWLTRTLLREGLRNPLIWLWWCGAYGSTFGSRLLTVLAGRGWRGWKSKWKSLGLQLLTACPLLEMGRRQRAFCRCWDLLIQHELVRLAARTPAPVKGLAPGSWTVDQMDIAAWQAVHELEHERGQAFRWTKPVSRLRWSLPPQDRWELTIDVYDARSAERLIAVLWDGQPIALPSAKEEEDSLHLVVPGARHAAVHDLMLLCVPYFPSRHGSSDGRALGLSVTSFQCTAAERNGLWADAPAAARAVGGRCSAAGARRHAWRPHR